jgi:hypothetical protein
MMRRAIVLCLCIAALAGCSRGAEVEAPEQDESFVDAPYRVELTGGVDLTFDGRTELRIFALTGGGAQLRHLNLLAVKPKLPIEIEDGRFWVLLDIVGYRGDGRYTIEPRASAAEVAQGGGEQDLQGLAGGNLSNVVVEYMQGIGEPIRLRPAQPCRASVEAGGREGTIDCPAMESPDGRETSLLATWG